MTSHSINRKNCHSLRFSHKIETVKFIPGLEAINSSMALVLAFFSTSLKGSSSSSLAWFPSPSEVMFCRWEMIRYVSESRTRVQVHYKKFDCSESGHLFLRNTIGRFSFAIHQCRFRDHLDVKVRICLSHCFIALTLTLAGTRVSGTLRLRPKTCSLCARF